MNSRGIREQTTHCFARPKSYSSEAVTASEEVYGGGSPLLHACRLASYDNHEDRNTARDRADSILMSRTYVTDLTHYLATDGGIVKTMPKEAREIASFLALVVDAVTSQFPNTTSGIETGMRCRTPGCHGDIIGALDGPEEPVHWYCLDCGDNGTVSSWQGTKWDSRSK